jgi:hypothetical protein
VKRLFGRKSAPESISKFRKRVERIPTPDLITWAGQALNAMGRGLHAYDRNAEASVLDELVDASEALHEVVLEVRRRAEASAR